MAERRAAGSASTRNGDVTRVFAPGRHRGLAGLLVIRLRDRFPMNVDEPLVPRIVEAVREQPLFEGSAGRFKMLRAVR